jgi:hypothetical protein
MLDAKLQDVSWLPSRSSLAVRTTGAPKYSIEFAAVGGRIKDVSLRGLNTEQFMAATHSRCRNLRTSAPTTLE